MTDKVDNFHPEHLATIQDTLARADAPEDLRLRVIKAQLAAAGDTELTEEHLETAREAAEWLRARGAFPTELQGIALFAPQPPTAAPPPPQQPAVLALRNPEIVGHLRLRPESLTVDFWLLNFNGLFVVISYINEDPAHYSQHFVSPEKINEIKKQIPEVPKHKITAKLRESRDAIRAINSCCFYKSGKGPENFITDGPLAEMVRERLNFHTNDASSIETIARGAVITTTGGVEDFERLGLSAAAPPTAPPVASEDSTISGGDPTLRNPQIIGHIEIDNPPKGVMDFWLLDFGGLLVVTMRPDTKDLKSHPEVVHPDNHDRIRQLIPPAERKAFIKAGKGISRFGAISSCLVLPFSLKTYRKNHGELTQIVENRIYYEHDGDISTMENILKGLLIRTRGPASDFVKLGARPEVIAAISAEQPPAAVPVSTPPLAFPHGEYRIWPGEFVVNLEDPISGKGLKGEYDFYNFGNSVIIQQKMNRIPISLGVVRKSHMGSYREFLGEFLRQVAAGGRTTGLKISDEASTQLRRILDEGTNWIHDGAKVDASGEYPVLIVQQNGKKSMEQLGWDEVDFARVYATRNGEPFPPDRTAYTDFVLQDAKVVGHLRVDIPKEGRQPAQQAEFYLIDFSGIYAVIYYDSIDQKEWSGDILAPKAIASLSGLFSGKVVHKQKEYLTFKRQLASSILIEEPYKGTPLQNLIKNEKRAKLTTSIDSETSQALPEKSTLKLRVTEAELQALGYIPNKSGSPTTITPTPRIAQPTQSAREHVVYTLSDFEVLHHIRARTDDHMGKMEEDLWLLNFSGLYVIASFRQSGEHGTVVVLPESKNRLNLAFEVIKSEGDITDHSTYATLRREILSASVSGNSNAENPLYHQAKNLMFSNFTAIIDDSDNPRPRTVNLHALDDPSIFTRFGADSSKIPRPVPISEHPDRDKFNFRALTSPYFDGINSFRPGRYTIRSREVLGDFSGILTSDDTVSTLAVRFVNFGGIYVWFWRRNSGPTTASFIDPDRRINIDRALANLKTRVRGDGRTLDADDTNSLFALASKYSLRDQIYEGQTVPLSRRLVESEVGATVNDENILVMDHDTDGLLDRLGFEPENYPDIRVTAPGPAPADTPGPLAFPPGEYRIWPGKLLTINIKHPDSKPGAERRYEFYRFNKIAAVRETLNGIRVGVGFIKSSHIKAFEELEAAFVERFVAAAEDRHHTSPAGDKTGALAKAVMEEGIEWFHEDIEVDTTGDHPVLVLKQDDRHLMNRLGWNEVDFASVHATHNGNPFPPDRGKHTLFKLQDAEVVGDFSVDIKKGAHNPQQTAHYYLLDFSGVYAVVYRDSIYQKQWAGVVIHPDNIEFFQSLFEILGRNGTLKKLEAYLEFTTKLKESTLSARAYEGTPLGDIRRNDRYRVELHKEGDTVSPEETTLELKVTEAELQALGYVPNKPGSPTKITPTLGIAQTAAQPVRPVPLQRPKLLFTVSVDGAGTIPSHELQFLDFQGVLVIISFSGFLKRGVAYAYMIKKEGRKAVLDKYRPLSEGTHGLGTIAKLQPVIFKNGVLIHTMSAKGMLEIRGKSPAILKLPEETVSAKPWWEDTTLTFPGGIEDAKLWGYFDPAITLTNPYVSGTVVISDEIKFNWVRFGRYSFLTVTVKNRTPTYMLFKRETNTDKLEAFFPRERNQVRTLSSEETVRFTELVRTLPGKPSDFHPQKLGDTRDEYTENGVRFQIDIADVKKTGIIDRLSLILPDGIESGRKLGMLPEERDPIDTNNNPRIISRQTIHTMQKPEQSVIEKDADFYLIEQSGLLIFYFQKQNTSSEDVYAQIVPESFRAEVKRVFDLSPAGFDSAIKGLAARLSHASPALASLVHHNGPGEKEFVAYDGSFKLTFPAESGGKPDPELIGRLKLEVYEESEALKALGYKKEKPEVLYQSHSFGLEEKREDFAFFRVGGLIACYSKINEAVWFYKSGVTLEALRQTGQRINPAFFRFWDGKNFVPIDKLPPELARAKREVFEQYGAEALSALPDARIELAPQVPGGDLFTGAKIHLPLTPELTETTGLPSEVHHELDRVETYREKDGSTINVYKAGPFAVAEVHMTGSGFSGNTFVVYTIEESEKILRRGKDLSCTSGIFLYQLSTKPGHHVPAKELHPADMRERSLDASLSDPGTKNFVLRFREQLKLGAGSISIQRKEGDEEGFVLTYKPSDRLLELLGVKTDGEGKSEQEAERLEFQIGTPAPDSVEVAIDAVKKMIDLSDQDDPSWKARLPHDNDEPVTFPGVILSEAKNPVDAPGSFVPSVSRGAQDDSIPSSPTVELHTSTVDYPVGTAFNLVTSHGSLVTSSASDPRTPGPQDPKTESKYQLSLPVTRLSGLGMGQSVTIIHNGVPQEYKLQSKKGHGYHLTSGGAIVGTLETSGKKLSIQFGKNFRVEGEIPGKEQIKFISVRGVGGPKELSDFFGHLARNMGGHRRLERLAASLEGITDFKGQIGMPVVISIPEADIQFAFNSPWQLAVLRTENTPDDFFLHVLDAVLETKRENYRKSVIASVGGVARDSRLVTRDSQPPTHDYHPYPEDSQTLTYSVTDDFSLSGTMDSRFQDASLKEMNLTWFPSPLGGKGQGEGGEHTIALPVDDSRKWEWGYVDVDGSSSSWQEVGEETITWTGLTAPYSSDKVKITRDFSVTITRSEISKATWVEHRTYQLQKPDRHREDPAGRRGDPDDSTGSLSTRGACPPVGRRGPATYFGGRSARNDSPETIEFEIKLSENGELSIEKATWAGGEQTKELSLRARGEAIQWADSGETSGSPRPFGTRDDSKAFDLVWENHPKNGPLQRMHFVARLNRIPVETDVTGNLTQTTSLTLPLGAGTLHIIWEWGNTNGMFLYSVDHELNGKFTNLRGGPIQSTGGFQFPFDIKWTIEPFGEVSARFDFVGFGSAWEVKTNTEVEEAPIEDNPYVNKMRWVGEKTPEGYKIRHLIIENGAGQHYRAERLPPTLKTGEGVVATFDIADKTFDFFIARREGKIEITPLTLPLIPEGFSLLKEDEKIFIPPRLFSDGIDLRPGQSARQPLPFGIAEVRKRFTTDLSKLLRQTSADEVLYPTLDSMNAMIEMARKGDESNRTLTIQFIGSGSPLLFEETFVYDPNDPVKWKPVGLNGKQRLDNHYSSWNGQERQTDYILIDKTTHEWIPFPPGTTRFYSVLMPGTAGFFCLINATGSTPSQLERRRQAARDGFHRYLHAQAAGLVENISSRYAASAEWEVDDDENTAVRLFEEQMTDSGPEKTGRWLYFEPSLGENWTSVFFKRGRTRISIGRKNQTEFEGLFQGIREKESNRILFVELGSPKDRQPLVFKATFLPGADPVFVEVPYQSLFEKTPPSDWIYTEGWVHRVSAKKPSADPEAARKRYVPDDEGIPPLQTRPLEIRGNLPEAGKDLLPYVFDEQEWEEMEIVRGGEIKNEHVELLDQWLARGGSDFQLLPGSITEFRQAQEEVNRIPRSEWKEKLHEKNPVKLRLMNANGVILEITLIPYAPTTKTLRPYWIFDANGKRNRGVTVRFIGRNPETGLLTQIITPVTYNRTGQDQEIKIFDPVELTGVLQTLRMITTERDGSTLFALYDATERREPEERNGTPVLHWAKPARRQRLAADRLGKLLDLMEAAEETFIVGGGDSYEEIIGDDKAEFRWTLSEYEKGVESDETKTFKRIRIQYALPHLTEPGSGKWNTIPIPFSRKLTLSIQDDLANPDNWRDVEMDVYRTRGDALLLVNPADPGRRYVLSFETRPGREGWPRIRRVRGFEAGLDNFYNPPQWNLTYHVERVRSETETTGLGRVQDVTAEYRETHRLPEEHTAYRYFFHVDEIKAETRFDLLIDPDGEIAAINPDSWEIDNLKRELNRAIIKTEVVSHADLGNEFFESGGGTRIDGGYRVYLKHRPQSSDEATGNTHYLVVDFKPDPATGNFLGHGVEVTNLFYKRISKDPRQIFFPSEMAQTFNYVRKGARAKKAQPYGYLAGTPIDDSSRKVSLIFYDETADQRREIEFELESTDGNKFSVLRKGSIKLFNFHTGEEIKISGKGRSVTTKRDDGYTKFTMELLPTSLDQPPVSIVCYLDDQGNIPRDFSKPFEIAYRDRRETLKAARGFLTFDAELQARADRFFQETYGIPASHKSRSEKEPDATLPGQKWRREAAGTENLAIPLVPGADRRIDTGEDLAPLVEQRLRGIWHSACMVFCALNEDVESLTGEHIQTIKRLAGIELAEQKGRAKTGRAPATAGEAEEDAAREEFEITPAAHAHAESAEGTRALREIVARLAASSEQVDQDALDVLERMTGETISLDAAIPREWDSPRRAAVAARLRSIFRQLGSALGVDTTDIESLKAWFNEYIASVETADTPPFTLAPLRELRNSNVLNTGFGIAMLLGLKTYTSDRSDQSDRSDEIQEFTEALITAALSVYKDHNEILARELAELVLGVVLAEEVEWDIRDEVLYSGVDKKVIGDHERLAAYHDYALVLPFIRDDIRQRVLRVLRRHNIGEAEKSLLDSLVDAYFKDSPDHPVWKWKDRHGVIGWLSPLTTDETPPPAGSPEGEGGTGAPEPVAGRATGVEGHGVLGSWGLGVTGRGSRGGRSQGHRVIGSRVQGTGFRVQGKRPLPTVDHRPSTVVSQLGRERWQSAITRATELARRTEGLSRVATYLEGLRQEDRLLLHTQATQAGNSLDQVYTQLIQYGNGSLMRELQLRERGLSTEMKIVLLAASNMNNLGLLVATANAIVPQSPSHQVLQPPSHVIYGRSGVVAPVGIGVPVR